MGISLAVGPPLGLLLANLYLFSRQLIGTHMGLATLFHQKN